MADANIHHTVYRITNNLNNKIYIGVHSTKNPYDSYMGSSKLIRNAIRKYGKDNFTKEVLFDFRTRKEALDKEAEIVNENFVVREDTYNLCPGGLGPGEFHGRYGKPHTEKAKQIISKKVKLFQTGLPKSEEHKVKIGISNKGNKRPDLIDFNRKTKSHKIIFESTEYNSVREAMRLTGKSQYYIQKRAERI